jgi:hypothetical protein
MPPVPIGKGVCKKLGINVSILNRRCAGSFGAPIMEENNSRKGIAPTDGKVKHKQTLSRSKTDT